MSGILQKDICYADKQCGMWDTFSMNKLNGDIVKDDNTTQHNTQVFLNMINENNRHSKVIKLNSLKKLFYVWTKNIEQLRTFLHVHAVKQNSA